MPRKHPSQVYLAAIAPMLSLFIFNLGNGLLTTLITLRMDLEGISSFYIGAVNSAYYFGLVISAFRSETFIVRVGHIRAFATFASLLAVVTMLQGLFVNPTAWLFLRFIGGFCMGGLFIVIESWFLVISNPTTRGTLLGIYMVAFYSSQGIGQFLLNISDPKSILPFTIATMVASLSVIPVAMTKIKSPQFEKTSVLKLKNLFAISQSGFVGSFASGLILGASLALIPLYLNQIRFSVSEVALVMAFLIFGGMAGQFPFGYLSDKISRRGVLMGLSILATLIGGSIIFFPQVQVHWVIISLLFLFGAFTFPIYPISISHACDVLEAQDIIAATQGLLLAYSIGAAISPLLAPFFIHWLGPSGLFIYLSSILLLLAIFFKWRTASQPVVEAVGPQEFVPVTQNTPIATELDPRAEEE